MDALLLVGTCIAAFVALVHFPAYVIGTVAMVLCVLAFVSGQFVVAYLSGLSAVALGLLIRGSQKDGVRRSILQQLCEMPPWFRYPAIGAAVASLIGLLSITSRGQRPDLLNVASMILVAGGIGAAVAFMAYQWRYRIRAPRR